MADDIVNRIIQSESGGNPSARNPNSTAVGLGQFTEGTWLDTVHRHAPDRVAGLSREEILALREDPDLSREMTGRYAEENARVLEQAGHTPDAGNLLLTHFAGATGARNLLSADPSTPVDQVLSSRAIEANASILAGRTVGEVIDYFRSRAGESKDPAKAGPRDDSISAVPLRQYTGGMQELVNSQTAEMYARSKAMMGSVMGEVGSAELFEQARRSSTPRADATREAVQHITNRLQANNEAFAQALRQSPDEVGLIVNAQSAETKKLDWYIQNPDYAVHYVALTSQGQGEISDTEARLLAVEMKAATDLQKMADDYPVWKTVADFAMELSDINNLYRLAQIAGAENIYSADDALVQSIVRFQSEVDPDVKAQMWEDIREFLTENFTGTMAMDLMSKFVTPEGIHDLWVYGGESAALSTIGPAMLGGWLVRKLGTGVRVLATMGRTRAAAKAALDAAQNPAAANAVGTNKPQLANDVSPMPSPVDAALLDGLPEAYQKEIQATAESVNQTTRQIIDGTTAIKIDPYNQSELGEVTRSINNQLYQIVNKTDGDVTSAIVRNISPDEAQITVNYRPKDELLPETASMDQLRKAGERLLILQDEGMITPNEVGAFAKLAKEKGSTIESINHALDQIAEGVSPADAAAFLDEADVRSVTYTVKARFDDTIGKWDQEYLPVGQWVLSNRAAAKTPDTVEDVEKALRLDNITAKVAVELRSNVDNIFSQLKETNTRGRRKATAAIQRALIEGDEWVDPSSGIEIGKVWSTQELRSKFQLTDPEIAAYYKLRTTYDHLHMLTNQNVRDEMVRAGYRDIRGTRPIRYKDKDGNDQEFNFHGVGKTFMDVDEADSAARSSAYDVRSFLDLTTGEVTAYSRDALKAAYSEGKVLVRLAEPTGFPSKGQFQHILVNFTDSVRDLPQQVLHKKTAYVPRVYDRGVYFVKKMGWSRGVDGKPQATNRSLKTIGMADNASAAKRLAERMSAQTGENYVVRVSDQIDAEEMMLQEARGSLYTSPRGNPVPFYRLDGSNNLVQEKASRVSPLDALSQNIANIAFHLPRNEWRMAQIERLRKSAKNLGVQFNGIHVPATGGTPGNLRFIERQRQNLRDWLAVPDSFNEKWDEVIQHMYEVALGIKVGGVHLGRPVAAGLWWLKSNDPVTAMRSAAFHTMLGLFNPVQLFVQGSGFTVAANHIMFKGNAQGVVATFRRQVLLHQAELAKDANVRRSILKGLSKVLGDDMDVDELAAMAEAWSRSGLREGVLTNADWSMMESGFGSIIAGLQNVANKRGLIFYRSGELFNRRFSFSAAWQDFATKNPEVDMTKLTDRQIGEIVSKANDYMLNLGRANRAAWQKGLLSIPTQFWQVWAKMMEQLLTFNAGKTLTVSDKIRLVAGQMGLFGLAGVPIGGRVGQYYLSAERGTDDETIVERGIDEGLFGVLFALFGADVEVANRAAILGDVENLVYEWMGGDADMGRLLSGVFGNLGVRGFDAMQRMSNLGMSAYFDAPPTTVNDWVAAADGLADITSSWSNASRAYYMYKTGDLLSRSGNLVADMSDATLSTLVATAIGFQPKDEMRAYNLQTLNRMNQAYKNDVKKSIRNAILHRIQAYEVTGVWSDTDNQKLEYTIRALGAGLSPQDRDEISEQVREELAAGETMFARETRRFVRSQITGDIDRALDYFTRTAVGGTRQDAGGY